MRVDLNFPCWQIFLPFGVVLLATWRMFALAGAPDFSSAEIPAAEVRAMLGGPLPDARQLMQLGVTRIEYQRFDPHALLVATPGADRRPGRAGADDNFNGRIDDRAELGATYSDDLCLVVSADALAELPADSVMILQRGAYAATNAHDWQRAVVVGSKEGRPWSMVVGD